MAAVGELKINVTISHNEVINDLKGLQKVFDKFGKVVSSTFSKATGAMYDKAIKGAQELATEQQAAHAEMEKYETKIAAVKSEAEALNESLQDVGSSSSEAYENATKEVFNLTEELNSVSKQIENTRNLMFDLAAVQVAGTENETADGIIQRGEALFDANKEATRLLATSEMLQQQILDTQTLAEQYKAEAEKAFVDNVEAQIDANKAALQELSQRYDEAAERSKEYGEASQNAFERAEKGKAIMDGIGAAMGKFGSAVMAVVSGVSMLAGKVFGALKAGATRVGGAAKGLLNHFASLSGIKAVVGGLSIAFKKLGSLLGALAQKAIKALVNSFKEGVTNLATSSNQINSVLSSLKTETEYLGNNMAAAFSPIITAVVPILAKLVGWVNTAIGALGQLIAAFSGKSTYTKAVKQQQDYAGAVSDSTGAVKDLDKATNSLSIDELNTFSENDSSDGGGGGGGGATVGGVLFEEVEIDYALMEVAQKLTELWENMLVALQPTIEALGRLWDQLKVVGSFAWQGLLDFYNRFLVPVGGWVLGVGLPRFVEVLADGLEKVNWGSINNSLAILWDALARFAVNVGKGLLWFWEKVLVPLGTWVLNDAVPVFLELLAAAIEIVNGVVEALQPLGKWLWEKFLEPIAKWTGGVIVTILGGLANVLTRIGDWIKNNQSVVEKMTIALLAFFAAWGIVKLMSFIQMSGGVVAALKNIAVGLGGATLAKIKDKLETMAISLMYAKDFVVSLAQGTAALAKQAAQFLISKAAKLADAVAQGVMTAATVAWNAAATIAAAVTTAFGAAVAFLTSPIGIVILAIGALIAIVAVLANIFSKDAMPALERFNDSVSEGTQEAVGTAMDTWEEAEVALKQLSWGGAELTEEMADSIISSFRKMRDQLTDSLESQRQEALEELNYLFQEEAALHDERLALLEEDSQAYYDNLDAIKEKFGEESDEYAAAKAELENFQETRLAELMEGASEEELIYLERLNGINATYDEQIASVAAKEEEARLIQKAAAAENRDFTEEENARLLELGHALQDDSISILSATAEEEAAIREKMAENAELLSAQQAMEVVRNAIETRDSKVDAANEEYEKTVAALRAECDESDEISKQKMEAAIADAERLRDETIAAAEATHLGVIEQAKEQAGEHVDTIDWETGESKSRWTTFWEKTKSGWNSFWDKVTGKSKESADELIDTTQDIADGMTEGIEGAQDGISDAFANNNESAQDTNEQDWEIHSPSKVMKRLAENIGDGFVQGTTNSRAGMVNAFKDTFNAVLGATESFINSMLNEWGKMLTQLANAASKVPNAPRISVPSLSYASVPRLARGAVIPPNREFMAVLGDQRSGMNIETPESLLRQIMREENGSGSKEGLKAAIREALQELGLTGAAFDVSLEVDSREIARASRVGERKLGHAYGGAFAHAR